jgi:ubiquinone/menaquinone biosynthesis C-methylase UbiE
MSTRKGPRADRHGTAHRFSASGDFVARLESSERREAIPKEDILPRLGLSKQDLVVDLGAGIGYFAFPMAELASEVISVDVEPKMLGVLASRMKVLGAVNVRLLRAEMTSLPIADSCVDFILAAFVYHEVADQGRLLDECARVLKPSGRLVVIDFQKHETSMGPPVSERKTPAHVLRTARPWFRLDSRYDTDIFYLLGLARTQGR